MNKIPIVYGEENKPTIQLGDGWLPECLVGVDPAAGESATALIVCEQDEDGAYIVSDYRTVVYGDGDTALEALRDYIESLHEYLWSF